MAGLSIKQIDFVIIHASVYDLPSCYDEVAKFYAINLHLLAFVMQVVLRTELSMHGRIWLNAIWCEKENSSVS